MFDYELLDGKYIWVLKIREFNSIQYNPISIAIFLRKRHNVKFNDVIELSKVKPSLIDKKITFKNKKDAICFTDAANSIILANKLKECV